ncbi:SDR family oxidoreductase [Vitiosangium sp. GDMCC 1.1324]|uniref:SDR family NAD(P)-dependent oxidoreductase n=1 Tax=Vitiosangium sp. (strain GDMCC 1.1324) TaxID=2138576 RepID=UPI000D3AE7DA|nr:SDR family oxidoreductase [Vitiosangium sp. GDMCC 1.1324]PTL82730.1 short-chain dehydrogenase [Vitiosangium sp. GDMCC 1.1324]
MESIVQAQARRYAMVTGASSGIGRELAAILAREGYALVLVARRTEPMRVLAEQLQQAHGTPSVVVGADLGAPEGVATVMREVKERQLDVEVLVNNAGFGLAGPFDELPAGQQLEMLDLNIRALTSLTREVIPGMVARRRGYVLNVASTAAFQPGPFMSVYYATKAYVLSFSAALHEELRGRGVTVTALCPGYTETEFAARAAEHQRPRLFSGPLGSGDARHVAEAGYRALVRGKAVVVPGVINRLGAWFMPLTPLALKLRITRYLNASER